MPVVFNRRVTVTLDDATRQILDKKTFATIATINPDGAPQASLVWVDRDGDAVVFSSTTARQKVRNLRRDPRISLAAFDIDNPYDSIEIRGRAEVVDDPDKTLPKRLSRKYLGEEPPPEPDVQRVIVRIVPEKVHRFAV